MATKLDVLLAEARACTLCASSLPQPPRPLLQAARASRIVVVGQAPGAQVHASGTPWDGASGDNFAAWLGVDRALFEDARAFAMLPMGFCWPGRRAGGDKPPRPECAPAWHPRILAALPSVRLTLLVGRYAHARYLTGAGETLTETVRRFREWLPQDRIPLPHPSWRSKLWMAEHPWFARELLPVLRARVKAALAS